MRPREPGQMTVEQLLAEIVDLAWVVERGRRSGQRIGPVIARLRLCRAELAAREPVVDEMLLVDWGP